MQIENQIRKNRKKAEREEREIHLDEYLRERSPENYRDGLYYLDAQLSKLQLVEAEVREKSRNIYRIISAIIGASDVVNKWHPQYEYSIKNHISRASDAMQIAQGTSILAAMRTANPHQHVTTSSVYVNNGDTGITSQKIGTHGKSTIKIRVGKQPVASNDHNFNKYLDPDTADRVFSTVIKSSIEEISNKIVLAEEAARRIGAELVQAQSGDHPMILQAQEKVIDYCIEKMEDALPDEDIPSDNMRRIEAERISPVVNSLSSSLSALSQLETQAQYLSDHKKSVWVSSNSDALTSVNTSFGTLEIRKIEDTRLDHEVFKSGDGRIRIKSTGDKKGNGRQSHDMYIDNIPVVRFKIDDKGMVTARPISAWNKDYNCPPEKEKLLEKTARKIVANFVVPLAENLKEARIDAEKIKHGTIYEAKIAKEISNHRSTGREEVKKRANAEIKARVNSGINSALDDNYSRRGDAPAAP